MDENYLDSLLNEISLDNEIEHDVKAAAGKEGPNQDNSVEQLVNQDSDTRLSMEDDILGESQLDELDELDRMAEADMSELDFSDLDFDDLDMFDMSPKEEKRIKRSASNVSEQSGMAEEVPEINLDDLSIDDMFFEQTEPDTDTEVKADLHTFTDDKTDQAVDEAIQAVNETVPADMTVAAVESGASAGDIGSLQDVDPGLAASVDNLNADDFLSDFAGFQDGQGEALDSAGTAAAVPEDVSTPLMSDIDSFDSQDSSGDINELLGMLGIEEGELSGGEAVQETAAASAAAETFGPQTDLDSDMNDFLNDSITEPDEEMPVKPRISLAQLLFGSEEDDEPELSEEELEAIKAERKAKRDAKKAERKTKTDEKKAEKAAKDAAVQADKAAKKALREAQRKAVLDAAPPDKKLNRKAVTVVMVFFAVVAAFIVLGTDTFSYNSVIKKATDYFQRQKYHMAYDEIAGVEVKEEDKELESKIYTVMYVERLYETYEINVKLMRMDKALDSLLRGLVKYDEHYEEAQELNIVSDIDSSRSKIIAALEADYGLSEADAYAILALDSYAYRQKLAEYAVDLDEDAMISLDTNTSEED